MLQRSVLVRFRKETLFKEVMFQNSVETKLNRVKIYASISVVCSHNEVATL